jgi:hypothetical protein
VFVDIQRRGASAEVVLDAVDSGGGFLNQAETNLTILDPQLGRKTLTMTQVAPGRYKSSIETPAAGTYHLELSQNAHGEAAFRQTRGLVVGYPEELRLRPTNETLLRKIAEVTAGRYDPRPAALFEPDGRSVPRAEPLWPYLLAAAAVIFVADVALRRIDFSLWRRRR